MRTYLMENVLPTLTKGLQEVAQVLPSLLPLTIEER
jgi:hypothetical protein